MRFFILVVCLLFVSSPVLAFDLLADNGIHGFLDFRAGHRLYRDDYERGTSLLEGRMQLEYEHQTDIFLLQLRGDLVADDLADDRQVDFETGEGWIDLREANILFSPVDWVDIKFGRQILTWGTGDLLFINDLFPKDWQSFFSGRDAEYLKAPSDAVMVSFFPELATVDVVFTPRFDSDRYISGQRFSYWNPQLGRIAGRDAIINADQPDDWFDDYELAVRVTKNLAGYELALYGYRGYWKSPVGFNPSSAQPASPRMNSYGFSMRGALGQGIAHAEFGYYDSKEDRHGTNPSQPNSELRYLLGYEQELAKELTAGGQFYLEQLLDYDNYRDHLSDGMDARDEYRQVLTLRLTQMLLQQRLTLSLFNYWSPTDDDYYLRPVIKYKLTDNWLLTTGGNFFGGKQNHTFFAQFKDNTNVYAGIRYSF